MSSDTATADKTHRQHAVTDQVNADLKDSALTYLSSGHFGVIRASSVAVAIAYNLTLTTGIPDGRFTKARSATLRRKRIHVSALIARGARKTRFRLDLDWHW